MKKTIEVHELMVGNIVGMNLDEFPDNIFIVEEIGDTCKIIQGRESHFVNIGDLEAIELTEKWLLDLGYEITQVSEHVFPKLHDKRSPVKREDILYEHKEFRGQKDEWRNLVFIAINDPESKTKRRIGISGIDDFSIMLSDIGAVHQFQNAWYAFCGEQLKTPQI